MITATTGSTRVGGFTPVGHEGRVMHVTPVQTITLSREESVFYYVLSFTFLGSALFCVAMDKRPEATPDD